MWGGTYAAMVPDESASRNSAALLEQARWRTTIAEQRDASIRAQAAALLAVDAVVGGIGASAIGTLDPRLRLKSELSALSHIKTG